MSRETGAEQRGARAGPSFRFEVQVSLSVAMSGRTGAEQLGDRAELSR